MNNLIFPEGITHSYRYTTYCDYIPAGHSVSSDMSHAYAYSKNNVIDIRVDTSNVTNMKNMFYECDNLTSVTHFDTSNVTNMYYMFNGCESLTTIPQLDTSNVTNMSCMFYCSSLASIPELDCSKVSNISSFLGYSDITTLTDLGGFKDLGESSSLSGTSDNYFLGKAPNLTHTSIMNVINNLYDRASAGYSVLTLKLHANHHTLLTDEEKAIATNKGWTLS